MLPCVSDTSATEVKRLADGSKIAAIIGNAAVIVSHKLDEVDKEITFGLCTEGFGDPQQPFSIQP
ncbi:hypothetical protein EYZ11_000315 [Aspergillus tanneri]|uniref:Uncharacterized protein n=1 Tax=Aspergillus tanneri TaxID=1220188 RepID=A0A4S3JXK1_9EURO|nr:hypothetical protein EYZ11_000315 [Aspergillus tanneri]